MVALICNDAAKMRVISKIINAKDAHNFGPRNGRCHAVGCLNGAVAISEADDGIRRYYDGVLVHEERI